MHIPLPAPSSVEVLIPAPLERGLGDHICVAGGSRDGGFSGREGGGVDVAGATSLQMDEGVSFLLRCGSVNVRV